jgi:hypothetical protein
MSLVVNRDTGGCLKLADVAPFRAPFPEELSGTRELLDFSKVRQLFGAEIGKSQDGLRSLG